MVRAAAGGPRGVLLRLADLMERDAETLARLDSEDAGKPITECRTGDVPGAITSIRWFAEAADKLFGRLAPTGPDHLGMIGRSRSGWSRRSCRGTTRSP